MNNGKDSTKRVLVVEDDQELATLYKQYLSDEYTVQIASTGAEALDSISDQIDVILLDRRLPDIDGETVLEQMRKAGYNNPVAVVTGIEPRGDIVEMPFDEYLTKPVERDTLIRTVRVLLNRSKFQQSSREFFRLATKKASLTSIDPSNRQDREYDDVLTQQMDELQSTLQQTMHEISGESTSRTVQLGASSEEFEALLEEINDHTLPAVVEQFVSEYNELESPRPPFMWKWVHHVAFQNELPTIYDRFSEKVAIDKTLIILYITILDDILEKQRDQITFDELAMVPFSNSNRTPDHVDIDSDLYAFVTSVWQELESRLQSAPEYQTYSDLFLFDLRQAIDSIRYTEVVIETPAVATMSDLTRYESHNMVMFAYADIDLMHSPPNLRHELPQIRELIWEAQQMTRIGNWVSTWEREIREGDYSAGPIVYALNNDIISPGELERCEMDESAIEVLIERMHDHGIEKHFLVKWEHHLANVRDCAQRIEDIDFEPFIAGLEEILRYHLATRGLK